MRYSFIVTTCLILYTSGHLNVLKDVDVYCFSGHRAQSKYGAVPIFRDFFLVWLKIRLNLLLSRSATNSVLYSSQCNKLIIRCYRKPFKSMPCGWMRNGVWIKNCMRKTVDNFYVTMCSLIMITFLIKLLGFVRYAGYINFLCWISWLLKLQPC